MECITDEEGGVVGELGEESNVRSLYGHMQRVQDRRGRRGRRYEAATVLTLMALAKLAGETTLSGIAHWVRLRGDWLQGVVPLRDRRLPCSNTYQYICERVNMESFQAEVEAFTAEVTAARERLETPAVSDEEVIWPQLVVDGKALRGSDRQAWPVQPAHMVLSAYHVQQRRVCRQMAISGRGGEAAAASALVQLLDLDGFVVSADAGSVKKSV